MNITVRASQKSDEPFLWAMLYQALYVPEGEPPLPREIVQQPELSQYVRDWGQTNDFGLIALGGEKPVGAVWLRQIKAYGYVDDNTPELSIAVLPEYRGLGLGTTLMQGLLATVRPRYAAISLSVSVDNPALRLYQRLGFEIVVMHGNSVTMKLTLH